MEWGNIGAEGGVRRITLGRKGARFFPIPDRGGWMDRVVMREGERFRCSRRMARPC